MTVRPPKKNDTIEIRLSDEAKVAFMEHCRQEQRTASEAIRLFIDSQIDRNALRHQRWAISWRIVAAGVVGALLGIGAAAPSIAHATQSTRAAFDRLDANHDGVLSYREFKVR